MFNNLRLREFCCVILLKAAIKRWENCGHKGMEMVGNNTQVRRDIYMMLTKYQGWYYSITPETSRQVHVFMLFTLYFDPSIQTSQQRSRLKPANIFPNFWYRFFVVYPLQGSIHCAFRYALLPALVVKTVQ